MLDIGTNTEMILGNKYGLAACSAASGPAFEGAKIQCGMRGLPGAIDHVKYEDGKWQYTTIGGEKPVGLCGSGLIDLVAELLRAGLLEENGILHSGQERSDTFMLVPPQETVFAQCEQNMSEDAQSEKTECLQRNEKNGSGQSRFENDCGVYLTQKDIGEVQLAKAAIAAGIRAFIKEKKHRRISDPDRVSGRWIRQLYECRKRSPDWADPGKLCEESTMCGKYRRGRC